MGAVATHTKSGARVARRCLVTAAVAATLVGPALRVAPPARAAAHIPAYEVAVGKTLLLMPVGHLHESDINFLARGISARLGVPVGFMAPTPWPWPVAAGDTVRGGATLDWLFARRPQGSWRVLAVLENDIADGDLDGVYGMANKRDGVAIVSLAAFADALRSKRPDVRARAEDQVVQVATHELIHTLGFGHCDTEGCLMAAITDKAQIARTTAPCERCALRIARSLRRPRDPLGEQVLRGDGWLRRGAYGRALEEYERASRAARVLGPQRRADLDNRLGAALVSMERVAEGERYVRRALDLAPNLAPAHYNMALIDAYAGRYERSYTWLRSGMAHDPSATSRHGFAGRFHIEVMEDPTRAIGELRAYREAGGTDPALLDALDALERRDVVIFEPGDVEPIRGRTRR